MINFDKNITDAIMSFPELRDGNKIISKIFESSRGIMDVNDIGIDNIFAKNILKGLYIKKTVHWACHGDKTEIGLIVQDYSSSSGRHYVDYLVIFNQNPNNVGTINQCIIKPNGIWIISPCIDNLGSIEEKVCNR